MSAKNLYRIDTEGTYFHVYNKGIENRTIFGGDGDYKVFLGFIKDYLSTPQDPESVKKSFTVKGRVFIGTPHQPKNYFDKVELIAYSLMPDHFHLVLHQVTKGSLESFIRSLCTRYSMYFNKKYKRIGSLFQGPYKSIQIKDISQLPALTRHIHHEGIEYSSNPEYSGKKETSWVSTKVVLSMKTADNSNDKELLNGITFEENNTQPLERRDPAKNIVKSYHPNLASTPRIPEFIGLTAVFLILLSFGVKNIEASKVMPNANNVIPPTTLGVSETEEIKPVAEVATESTLEKVVIKISDGSDSVNIRKDPTTNSEKIGQAIDGEIFEVISKTLGWYEIKLTDEQTGFISAKYIEQTINEQI